MSRLEMTITIIGFVFASSGFWTFVTQTLLNRNKRIGSEGLMLRGLAHDRICYLGTQYIKKGYISKDDYENLYENLYKPYIALGGNGSAQRIMKEVEKLPHFQQK